MPSYDTIGTGAGIQLLSGDSDLDVLDPYFLPRVLGSALGSARGGLDLFATGLMLFGYLVRRRRMSTVLLAERVGFVSRMEDI